ncbi:NAD(P)H-dependent oxidoreductase [Aestuariibacter sp. AA17]|uniref:FMN dependent NADH:quinone oxidoreductase n=1 Tax=Fluctibacter corallii TaxID=2984329 RepID=A0ABT3A9L6_9ALTE|nr:NAD(P)H-dependent oxidoreductase [Aestuariibacter sp. AA17]MCV2885375.1 NAD(P)H-dependent oxidoreductase [Aestuariibacter sp. AA17]
MKRVLAIYTGIHPDQSHSSKMVNAVIDMMQAKESTQAAQRDVAQNPIPHLEQEEMEAWITPIEQRTEKQQNLASLSDTLIAELQDADTLVIGMPMYNFGVPSTFKAWIDRVARAGITFKYTEQGPEGLLGNKKVIIVATRGGYYAGTEKDSQTQYLKDVFNFLGINDVNFFYAEGLAMGEERVSDVYRTFDKKISELIK